MPEGSFDQQVIDMLGEALSMALHGEAVEVAIAMVKPDGVIQYGFSGGHNRQLSLSAAIAQLNHRYQHFMVSDKDVMVNKG